MRNNLKKKVCSLLVATLMTTATFANGFTYGGITVSAEESNVTVQNSGNVEISGEKTYSDINDSTGSDVNTGDVETSTVETTTGETVETSTDETTMPETTVEPTTEKPTTPQPTTVPVTTKPASTKVVAWGKNAAGQFVNGNKKVIKGATMKGIDVSYHNGTINWKKVAASDVDYAIISEAGASVYSASKLASEEFPKFDVGQRSAASIARRLQDPLAELVKIDPKAIGVGQYQHDMNQKKLGESLNGVVEDCVNKVGVDLNTASAPLLAYISGISSAIAKNIVAYREENGKFADRRELLKVPKLGPKAYEQCAGFMRIQGGKNPLDATAVHPESYEAAEKLLKKQGYKAEDITNHKLTGLSLTLRDYKKLAEELEIGEITLRDIVKELEKPARDPRDEMPKPILRTDVLEMKDLKEGMVLKGTVRNVIDFGAFVDIGVHQDGLVHISQITDKFIKHPLEAVSVGDIVDVKVMSVDMKKKRIQLTMRGI